MSSEWLKSGDFDSMARAGMLGLAHDLAKGDPAKLADGINLSALDGDTEANYRQALTHIIPSRDVGYIVFMGLQEGIMLDPDEGKQLLLNSPEQGMLPYSSEEAVVRQIVEREYMALRGSDSGLARVTRGMVVAYASAMHFATRLSPVILSREVIVASSSSGNLFNNIDELSAWSYRPGQAPVAPQVAELDPLGDELEATQFYEMFKLLGKSSILDNLPDVS